MFKNFIGAIFAISFFSRILLANESSGFGQVLDQLNNTPASQLDFRLHLLEERIKGFQKRIEISINLMDSNGGSFGSFHDTKGGKYFEKARCYVKSHLIVCEVWVKNPMPIEYGFEFFDLESNEFSDFSENEKQVKNKIIEKIEQFKICYEELLSLVKDVVHPSIDSSDLRVIFKKRNVIELSSMEEYKKLQKLSVEDLVKICSQDKTLVIWEKGIPLYQEAFFED